jgi:hypothetical protein
VTLGVLVSLLVGLIAAAPPSTYYIRVTNTRGGGQISFDGYAKHLAGIASLLLGGTIVGGVILAMTAGTGSVWAYVIGLNGLFLFTAALFNFLFWLTNR